MSEVDPLSTILTILEDNWISENTNSRTPEFIKITGQKRVDYNKNQDYIIAQRPIQQTEPAGTGQSNKHEFDNFNIDIRVLGREQEQHFYNVLGEVKRILQLKKVLPATGYTILEWDGTGPDLSDKNYNLWRKLIPTQLKRYNVSR